MGVLAVLSAIGLSSFIEGSERCSHGEVRRDNAISKPVSEALKFLIDTLQSTR